MSNGTVVACVAGFCLVVGMLISYVFAPVAGEASAALIAPEAPTVVPTPGTCLKWMMAGDQAIYKCVDEEAPWATCYQPAQGVLQCGKY